MLKRTYSSILLGKAVRVATRLRHNGGSALPGLVVERYNPQFLQQTLNRLPSGVIIISGTNGKTTTTKIVSELLAKQGLKVFTNNSGSNFVRGVISAILQDIKITGKFDYDIAVLELDEAHAVKFCEVANVDYALFLNVQRDQLDRFGEIDHTAELLQKVAKQVQRDVVLNREDPRISKLIAKHPCYFGLSKTLLKRFPSDDALLGDDDKQSQLSADIILSSLKDQHAVYQIGSQKYPCDLALKGLYNAYNAAGALALCCKILPDVDPAELVNDLAETTSAFGRGEIFTINGNSVELFLVKNPSAFQLSLTSFADNEHDYLIAINDQIADGRDVSWLWNVDFRDLVNVKVASGTRATDMALRLKYDDVTTEQVIEDLSEAIHAFTKQGKKPKRIFATYTAMLEIRKILTGKSIL